MEKWGFIYTVGADSGERVDRIGGGPCELICVGIPGIGDGPKAALQLLEEGVQLIELCGAFAGPGLAQIVAAVDGRVPVGAVFYGAEAAGGLQRLFG